MNNEVELFSTAFSKRTTEALETFSNTAGLCLNLCAFISEKLKEDSIAHCIALGTLSCRGVTAFEYLEYPSFESSNIWDGHAWIEFPSNYIGEPSLLRSARSLPSHSNIKQYLMEQNIIERGAFLLSPEALSNTELNYSKEAVLSESKIAPLIEGLIAVND